MKLNESNVDRIIRAVAGVVLLYLGFGGVLAGGPTWSAWSYWSPAPSASARFTP